MTRLSARSAVYVTRFSSRTYYLLLFVSAGVLKLDQDNPSSFWRGKVYPDIGRGSCPADALK